MAALRVVKLLTLPRAGGLEHPEASSVGISSGRSSSTFRTLQRASIASTTRGRHLVSVCR